MAELNNVDAWELLIELVSEAGLSDYMTQFEQAKMAEDQHR